MAIHYHLAELVLRVTGGDRKGYLSRSRGHYEQFLKLLDSYDMLNSSDAKLLDLYKEDKDRFSVASTKDASARREAKISRFREEKELKRKLEVSHKSIAISTIVLIKIIVHATKPEGLGE